MDNGGGRACYPTLGVVPQLWWRPVTHLGRLELLLSRQQPEREIEMDVVGSLG